MKDSSRIADGVASTLDRARPLTDGLGMSGLVVVELRDERGKLRYREVTHNLLTQVGDQMYAERGVGITTTPVPTGMKLGTGSTAVAKTGAGAALVTYLANSQQAFDSTYPQSSLNGAARNITFKVTYAAGKATSASAITEAVIVNDAIADATSAAAATPARVLLAGIPSKASTDTLTLTWVHALQGS